MQKRGKFNWVPAAWQLSFGEQRVSVSQHFWWVAPNRGVIEQTSGGSELWQVDLLVGGTKQRKYVDEYAQRECVDAHRDEQ
ncbi:MAG: hypothetical protein Rhob2KO_27910 [Rhodopirellula baltica]